MTLLASIDDPSGHGFAVNTTTDQVAFGPSLRLLANPIEGGRASAAAAATATLGLRSVLFASKAVLFTPLCPATREWMLQLAPLNLLLSWLADLRMRAGMHECVVLDVVGIYFIIISFYSSSSSPRSRHLLVV